MSWWRSTAIPVVVALRARTARDHRHRNAFCRVLLRRTSLVRALRLEHGRCLPRTLIFSIASGFALLNTVLFASGLARIWHPWFFALVLVAPLVIFGRNLLRLIDVLRAIFRRWGELEDLRQTSAGILIPFSAILAVCTTVLMLAPTLSWDAMKMHLPLSQYYLQVHALEPKPGLDYSFFPQAAESLFALRVVAGRTGRGSVDCADVFRVVPAGRLDPGARLRRGCRRGVDRRSAGRFPARRALGRIRAEERCSLDLFRSLLRWPRRCAGARHPNSSGCKPECSFWPADSQPKTWPYLPRSL